MLHIKLLLFLMAIFSYGFTSYKFAYPLIGGVIYTIRNYSFTFFQAHPYTCSPLFKVFLMDFGMLLSFIFEIISIYRQSRTKKYAKPFKEFFKKYKEHPSSLFILLILTILDFSGVFLNSLLSYSDTPIDSQLLSLSRISEFFFVIILYYIFLKQSIHRHQCVALLFLIAGLLLLCIQGWITFNIFILISVFGNLLFSILEVTEKWIMDIRYLSPYEVVGFQGMFGMIMLLCIIILGNFTKCQKWMGVCEYDEINPKNIIYFNQELSNIFTSWYTIFEVFSYIILTTAYNILNHLMVKYLGPTHRIISDGVFSILSVTVSFFLEKQKITTVNIINQILGHICIIIGIVLYNEIIIVRFCGLDVNTDKEIKYRALCRENNREIVSLSLFKNEQIDLL